MGRRRNNTSGLAPTPLPEPGQSPSFQNRLGQMNPVSPDPVSQWQILHRVAQSQHHSQPPSAGKGCQCQCQLFPPGIIIMTDQNSRPRR